MEKMNGAHVFFRKCGNVVKIIYAVIVLKCCVTGSGCCLAYDSDLNTWTEFKGHKSKPDNQRQLAKNGNEAVSKYPTACSVCRFMNIR